MVGQIIGYRARKNLLILILSGSVPEDLKEGLMLLLRLPTKTVEKMVSLLVMAGSSGILHVHNSDNKSDKLLLLELNCYVKSLLL